MKALRNRAYRDRARLVAWYRAEQARTLATIFVTRFAVGFEKVFMGMPEDWDSGPEQFIGSNPFIGLMDRQGNPWPAYHTFRMLVAKLDGFDRASRMPGPEGVALYRFDFTSRRPVTVAWLEHPTPLGPDDTPPRKRVVFSRIRAPASATEIPTTADEPTTSRFEVGDEVALDLGLTPVILEEL